jgi:hypothetical protein
MESTPDRGNRQPKGPWSRWRWLAILLGALILFAVAFDLVGRLSGSGAQPGAEAASNAASTRETIRPEVTKLGRSGVRIVVDEVYHMTRNLQDEARADRMIACIEEGIATSKALDEREVAPASVSDVVLARNVRAKQVWMEVIRIYYECTTELDLAPPPDRPWSM